MGQKGNNTSRHQPVKHSTNFLQNLPPPKELLLRRRLWNSVPLHHFARPLQRAAGPRHRVHARHGEVHDGRPEARLVRLGADPAAVEHGVQPREQACNAGNAVTLSFRFAVCRRRTPKERQGNGGGARRNKGREVHPAPGLAIKAAWAKWTGISQPLDILDNGVPCPIDNMKPAVFVVLAVVGLSAAAPQPSHGHGSGYQSKQQCHTTYKV